MRLMLRTRRGKLNLRETHGVWARFAHYARSHALAIAAAVAAALATVAMQLLSPWPIKVIFDHVLTSASGGAWLDRQVAALNQSPTALLGWACGALLLLALLETTFAYFRNVLLATAGQKIIGKVRSDLFAHLQKLPPSAFESRATGNLLVRLTGDIQMLRQLMVGAVVTMLQSGVTITATLAVMFWLNPSLALLAVAAFPITLWSSWSIARRIRSATEKQREKESRVATVAGEVLGAMAVIQAFNREPIEQKRFARENRSSVRAGVKTTRLESRLYQAVSLASTAGLCAILYVGVRSVLGGQMTAGDLLVFVSYLRSINRPVRDLAKLVGQLAKSVACGQRIIELFEIQPTVRDRPGARPLEAPRGEIRYEDVSFAYGAGRPAIEGITLTVHPGERVAVVGATGAGKSTLLKLLLRFHDPDRGSVYVDGVELRSATLESLRRRLGWVHQDTVLFGISVADNIAFGRPDATLDEIRSVAARVCADEFIEQLPKGYDTVLGTGGATLSGGQRQRLALARALLRRPRILLLDEPATGLDALTRRIVEEAWLSPENRATTIVICHRLNEMHRFERVFMLQDGQLVGQGAHEALLQSCPAYAALVRAGSDSPSRGRLAEECA